MRRVVPVTPPFEEPADRCGFTQPLLRGAAPHRSTHLPSFSSAAFTFFWYSFTRGSIHFTCNMQLRYLKTMASKTIENQRRSTLKFL